MRGSLRVPNRTASAVCDFAVCTGGPVQAILRILVDAVLTECMSVLLQKPQGPMACRRNTVGDRRNRWLLLLL